MCDTMVALPSVTRDNTMMFAKNSDRQANEPHLIIRIPRQSYAAGSRLDCTYISMEQAEETFEVLLLKPSWIWGAEMGANEFGLNIGNEAVFTRVPYQKEGGLIGMDMLRLALERCRTADEALHYMIELLERFGQGGNCGYEQPFFYHNSFLIADRKKAWKLETAGIYWAAVEVKDLDSISNCLSIGEDFDCSHPRLIDHAREQGWLKKGQSFDFARCYTEPVYTYFSGSRSRRAMGLEMLQKNRGAIDTDTMKSILRSHQEDIQGRQFETASVKSICMHAGFLYGDHTTGSYVASIGSEQQSTYWITGASTPCLSVFKPFFFLEAEPLSFLEQESVQAAWYWWEREYLHRLVLSGRRQNLQEYTQERNRLEQQWLDLEARADSDEERLQLMNRACKEEAALLNKYVELASEAQPGRKKGNWYFRRYWRQQNKKAKITIP